MAITTETELRQFLSSKDIPCHEVELLSGGTANFCWRITTLLGRRSIIKHAEPFIRSRPQVQFPIRRMDLEHSALTTVPTFIPEDEHVRLPQVYHYFPDEHVMHIADGGEKTLKDSYIRNEVIDFLALGERIATWVARLHKATSDPETLKLAKDKFNDSIGKTVYRHSYNGLAGVLAKFGFDDEIGRWTNETFGSKLETDEVCLCHGDCWPGNFLVGDQEPVVKTEEAKPELRAPVVSVVDWEMVRIGNGATDVGQFAAECWLLDRFHGAKGLMDTFVKAYLKERPLNEDDKIRVAVHFATHIGFWPAFVPWTDEEGTRKMVEAGKEILEAVKQGDREILATGPLRTLFETS